MYTLKEIKEAWYQVYNEKLDIFYLGFIHQLEKIKKEKEEKKDERL
jgi:hypothetical protein